IVGPGGGTVNGGSGNDRIDLVGIDATSTETFTTVRGGTGNDYYVMPDSWMNYYSDAQFQIIEEAGGGTDTVEYRGGEYDAV
ncbi:hypothetical protein ACJBUA_11980, partial [Streptococcus suis]